MKKIFLASMIVLFAVAGFSDKPDIHGMLLFGKKASYISHLPMFHTPHDYQMIAEVELVGNGNEQTLAKYDLAKKKHSIFTLVPELMDLSKVISGEITTFSATIYKGHFERGGSPIGSVKVTVKKKLVAEKIISEKGASLDFLSFGTAGEYFLAHLIKGKPTYDAIYESSQPWKLSLGGCGRAGCPDPVRVPVTNSEPLVIQATQSEFETTHPENVELGEAYGINVAIKKPIYIEYKELAH